MRVCVCVCGVRTRTSVGERIEKKRWRRKISWCDYWCVKLVYLYVTVLAETNLTAHISETYIFIPLHSPSFVEHDKLFTFFIRLTSKKL